MGLDHPGFQKHSTYLKHRYLIRSDECSKEACKYEELQYFLVPCSLRI